MDNWTLFLIIFLVTAAAAAIASAVILQNRRKTRALLMSLDEMLNAAINGDFQEIHLDESLLSSVETKLAHFLSASEVSARNLAEEKSKIKTMIADISHQTKTPIANILLYTQLLSEQSLPPECRDYLDPLNAQAEKLNFLIGALVKTSRLEAGILTLHPKPTSLADLVKTAIEQIRPKAEGKGIRLTCDEAEGNAVFDLKWTTEALYNLLDNAVKYTPCGGSVSVSFSRYDLFCRITVSDSGIGIAESEQAKIFSRFYRSPSVAHAEGVGIGLYLARQIVSEQGGYLKVESELKKGSAFSLFLPSCESIFQNC